MIRNARIVKNDRNIIFNFTTKTEFGNQYKSDCYIGHSFGECVRIMEEHISYLYSNVELARDYLDLIELFNKYGAEYLLIGGYAVSGYGYIRATKDIDFLVKGGKSLRDVLEAFGYPYDLSVEESYNEDLVIQIGVPPNRIDILIGGSDFDGLYRRRNIQRFSNVDVLIVSLDDLIAMKEKTGRDNDERDVRELKRIRDRKSEM
jgi:hypothetical protein